MNLNNEYQKLNISYQQNQNEQNDLLALCSTYEDQLSICRKIIQSAGLTVNKQTFLLIISSFSFHLGTKIFTWNGSYRMIYSYVIYF